MKILIYGLNFAPELTGIGKYTGEMTAWLAAQGHEVRVVTAPPYYPEWTVGAGYSAMGYRKETWQGATVWRCPLWVPFRPGGLKRLVHLASFALSSVPVVVRLALWRPDVVWVVAPAFFCAPGAWLAARLAGAKCWLHIQDFEVDAAFELGLLKGRRLRALALGLERWLLGRFDRVSTISVRMMDHLLNKGVDQARVRLFANWVELGAFAPRQAQDSDQTMQGVVAQDLGVPADAVVALYSGNMGAKQGLEILAEAARLTQHRAGLVWVFCGEGVGKAALEAACAGLSNVRFGPLQPMERFAELMALAAIHLLPQRADAADLVMPSKLTGMLASGRPVVATALEHHMLAQVVAGCGIVTTPEDAQGFAAAVLALADAPERRATLGAAGRAYAEAHLGRNAVLGEFESDLKHLVRP